MYCGGRLPSPPDPLSRRERGRERKRRVGRAPTLRFRRLLGRGRTSRPNARTPCAERRLRQEVLRRGSGTPRWTHNRENDAQGWRYRMGSEEHRPFIFEERRAGRQCQPSNREHRAERNGAGEAPSIAAEASHIEGFKLGGPFDFARLAWRALHARQAPPPSTGGTARALAGLRRPLSRRRTSRPYPAG